MRAPAADPASVGVIGLGLVGGSLARDLAARGTRVLGRDRDPRALRDATAAGVVAGPLERLEDVEAVVLAVPPAAALALLEREAPALRRRLLVMDVGSTKRRITDRAAALGLGCFVGAHPLAGGERAGWRASRGGLFRGATVYLCPGPATEPDALTRAEAFWRTLHAHPERLSAADHDARLAWTSHLPQLAASATALALAGAGITRDRLGPGGRDVTRLAASQPELWTEIALENADRLAPALATLERSIATLRAALLRSDGEALRAGLSAAACWGQAD